MELEGIVRSVGDIQQVSDKFRKREIVIVTPEERYPQTILVEFQQDRCELLNGIMPNSHVKIAFNVKGREWTNPQGQVKYFTTIQGWKIDVVGPPAPQQPVQQQYQQSPTQVPQPPAQPQYQQQVPPQQYQQQQAVPVGTPPPAGQPVQDDLPF